MHSRIRDLMNREKQHLVEARLKRFLDEGGTLQKWLDLPEDELEKLLQEGMRLYEEKHYGYARRIFAFLTLLAPNQPYYWRLLGCAQVQERNWLGARETFKMYASLIDDDRKARRWIRCCERLATSEQARGHDRIG